MFSKKVIDNLKTLSSNTTSIIIVHLNQITFSTENLCRCWFFYNCALNKITISTENLCRCWFFYNRALNKITISTENLCSCWFAINCAHHTIFHSTSYVYE